MPKLIRCIILALTIATLSFADGSFTIGVVKNPHVYDNDLGIRLSTSVYMLPYENAGFGGKVTFSRWQKRFSQQTVSTTLLELSPLLRFQTSEKRVAQFFLESTPGLLVSFASFRSGGKTDREPTPLFGLSFSPGLDVMQITVKPEMKILFGKGSTDKLLSLSAGLNF